MGANDRKRLHPLVFVAGGALALAALGFGIDVLSAGGTIPDVGGPLSGVTGFNFTLLGAVAGAVGGAFVGFGLV